MISFKTKTLVAVLLGIFVAPMLHGMEIRNSPKQDSDIRTLLSHGDIAAYLPNYKADDRDYFIEQTATTFSKNENATTPCYAYQGSELVGFAQYNVAGQNGELCNCNYIANFITKNEPDAQELLLHVCKQLDNDRTIYVTKKTNRLGVIARAGFLLSSTTSDYANCDGPYVKVVVMQNLQKQCNWSRQQHLKPAQLSSWQRFMRYAPAIGAATLLIGAGLYALHRTAPQHTSPIFEKISSIFSPWSWCSKSPAYAGNV